ncbi:MAG TPA: ABC transporter permease subunit [Steroidobacteraceae bacterium]|nr:ABC transporter permease subunit [Steroidobacteraceae bacterium]
MPGPRGGLPPDGVMRYKCRGMHTVVFIVRRLLGAIPTLALVVALSFLLTRLAPGGPFDEEQSLAPEIRANLEAAYGLDQPVHVQFARYVRGLLHGDFGPSFKFRDFTVSELIASGFRVSLALGSMAMLLALALGIPAGVWAARSRGGAADRVVMALAVAGISIPVFVVAPVLALVFGVWLGWLPVAGWVPGRPADLVLPVVSLALPVLAFIARLMRGSLLEVLRAPWIRAARARGLPERRVILRHALPAALLPVVSYVGPAAAAVLAGSLVVETLFGLPGMGRHLVQGALNRDYMLVMGMVIVYASLMIVLNLAADLLHASLDPRIRRERRL